VEVDNSLFAEFSVWLGTACRPYPDLETNFGGKRIGYIRTNTIVQCCSSEDNGCLRCALFESGVIFSVIVYYLFVCVVSYCSRVKTHLQFI
jgi:hypothetical protein